jgi:Glycosyltransferase Family 4/Glycosyl transferases group 1
VKTIVSVTPIAVERDSRTFKVAASMTRLGYRSIVVEGVPSVNLQRVLPFELITVGRRPESEIAVGKDVRAVSQVMAPARPLGPDEERRARRSLGDLLEVAAARAPSSVRTAAGPLWRTALNATSSIWPLLYYFADYLSKCRNIADALPPADLYYVHSQQPFPAVWWRGRVGRKPFVYDAHDLYWTLRQDGRPLPFADRGIWLVWDAVERRCARTATACVTVGEGVARHAKQRFRRDFEVIHNAHDRRLDDNGVRGLRERLELPPEAFLLAVSGNFKRGMAVEPMLMAMQRLPERVHVAFVGANYEPFEAVAERLGVRPRVHIVAPVPPTQIVPVFADADLAPVLYYPSSTSIRHALPNGFFHAVAAGVPVLYPRHLIDVRALATQHAVGWEIDPESESSIAVTVQRLLEAPRELAARRKHLRGIRDELSWANEELELAALLDASVGGRTS